MGAAHDGFAQHTRIWGSAGVPDLPQATDESGMVVKLFVAMIALALVQLIPLPVSILEWVSPVTGGFAGEIATALNTPDAFLDLAASIPDLVCSVALSDPALCFHFGC